MHQLGMMYEDHLLLRSKAGIVDGIESDIEVAGAIKILPLDDSCSHREWRDGTGYSTDLSKQEVPMDGQITAVADEFNKLSSCELANQQCEMGRYCQSCKNKSDTQIDREDQVAFLKRNDDLAQVQIESGEE